MSNEWGFSVLKKRLLENKELFEDNVFVPNFKSITFTGERPKDFPVSEIIWMRPKEIVANPVFIKSSASRSDLDQGLLGDCWFVAAAALLANGSKEQFEKCVPQDQDFGNEYTGLFRFLFWDYGVWKEVIIDDLLPTDGKGLIFCHNKRDKDEFWGALLEKAYAKHKGQNYEAISGGKLGTALVDFTGGLSELILLSQSDVGVPDNMYQLLQKNSAMETLIGASIYQHEQEFGRETRLPNGLFQGHAYSVIGMTELVSNSSLVQLLRLRNPHGENEWNGAWSDGSDEMRDLSEDTKKQLKQVSADDGEFWISIDDFRTNFDEICLCHLLPSSVGNEPDSVRKNWKVTEFHDAWLNGLTAGGCGNPPFQSLYWKNPQFQVQLFDPDTTDSDQLCTVIVSLMEKERLVNMNDVTIGFDIYEKIFSDELHGLDHYWMDNMASDLLLTPYNIQTRVCAHRREIRNPQSHPADGDTLPKSALKHAARSGVYQGYREVVRRFRLEPGSYVIIPSTFTPHKEAEFLLRIYTEKPILSEVLDEKNAPVQPSRRVPDPIFDLFKKHAGEDGKMDYKELKAFLAEASSKDLESPIAFQEETCRCLLVLMDNDRSGFLNMVEAQHAYKEILAYVAVFKQFDKDKSNAVDIIELGTMFKKLGFPVSRNVLLSIVRRYGGRDRQISLEDFIVAICKLATMYFVFVDRQKNVTGPDDIAVFTRNEFLQHAMLC